MSRYNQVFLAILVIIVIGAVTLGAIAKATSLGRTGSQPLLDAERMSGVQHGGTPGVATCPVSQQALEDTKLSAVRGTLALWYWDHPKKHQRAQILARVFIHDSPLGEGTYGNHQDVLDDMGSPRHVGSWNIRVHPRKGSQTIVVRHNLADGMIVPKGNYVTLCVWVNNSRYPRINWESQLTLITDRDMQQIRRRPTCDNC